MLLDLSCGDERKKETMCEKMWKEAKNEQNSSDRTTKCGVAVLNLLLFLDSFQFSLDTSETSPSHHISFLQKKKKKESAKCILIRF